MLEIERRFLIRLPLAWYAKFRLKKCNVVHITQMYLNESIPNLKGSHSRIRRSECELDNGCSTVSYAFTYKNQINPGINEEVEFRITETEYCDHLFDLDTTKRKIKKDRYIVLFKGHKFELDIFKNDLEGLSILEVELSSLNEKVILPPFFKIISEITDKKEYSNYGLSSISAEGLWKLATLLQK